VVGPGVRWWVCPCGRRGGLLWRVGVGAGSIWVVHSMTSRRAAGWPGQAFRSWVTPPGGCWALWCGAGCPAARASSPDSEAPRGRV